MYVVNSCHDIEDNIKLIITYYGTESRDEWLKNQGLYALLVSRWEAGEANEALNQEVECNTQGHKDTHKHIQKQEGEKTLET